MQEPITLYKLIVLYMLERSGFPLTRTQVTDFLLNREYTTNFLNLQQAVGELIDDGLLTCVTARNRSYLSITDEGSETLNFFKNQIDRDIRTDIDNYLKEHGFELRNENSVVASYRKAASGEYEAHLIAMDKGLTLIDLTLSVPLEETAVTICDNWKGQNQEIYQYLMNQLLN